MNSRAIEHCLVMLEEMIGISPNLISYKRLYKKGHDEKVEIIFSNASLRSASGDEGMKFKATIEIGVVHVKRTKKIKE